MSEPLKPSPALLCKLGGIAVHVETVILPPAKKQRKRQDHEETDYHHRRTRRLSGLQ